MFEQFPLVVEPPGDAAPLIEAAARAAEIWHLPPPELLRVGANGVFASDDVVLRVSRATAPMGVALKLASRLGALGVRVSAPARRDWLDFDGGLSVTAWQRIDVEPGAPIDWERVGAMVAKVHLLDPETVEHPLPFCADFPWWNFDEMIHEADRVDPEARAGLTRALTDNEWWIGAARRSRLVVCHGDVHPGNVLVDAHGPVLIDWDLLCVGPPEWDHGPLMTWTERWGGEPGIYEAFAAGYGKPIDGGVAEAIAEMRLVAATLMRLRRARLDPQYCEEAKRRLAYWRGDPRPPMWRAQ